MLRSILADAAALVSLTLFTSGLLLWAVIIPHLFK